MTISATTQGLRMGVATSTSRPTVPFDGQVISETDTDSLSVYKGSAWAPVSGLTFISATTISAAATVSVNNCFTSTYDNYRLLFQPTAATGADGLITMRLRLSGTDATTNYIGERLGASSATAFASNNPAGTDELLLGYIETTVPTLFVSSVDIFAPALARATVTTSITGSIGATSLLTLQIYSAHTSATAYDGFTILTSGTTVSGTIYLYGYAKA
jgi:hypothetical protein